jgi:outer membrane lipoprotein LolB
MRLSDDRSSATPAAARAVLAVWPVARCLWLLLLALCVAGCAGFGPTRAPAEIEAAGFAVQGKLGVRQGSEGFSSNFVWHQLRDRFEIELWGALGQGRTRLFGDDDGVTIETPRGEVFWEPDTSTAMRRWLGIDVPVSALQHWIRGRAAPGLPVDSQEHDGDGNLRVLEQLSWAMSFSGYGTADENGRQVPQRIVATHEDARLTIVARDWAFSAETAAP